MLTRRHFLHTSLSASGALLIGIKWDHSLAAPLTELNAFIKIASDNVITILAKNPDFGQGVKTSLPLIIAEELEADWSKVKVETPDLNLQKHGGQTSGGSYAIIGNFDLLRKTGAAAREMLIAAAAKTWQVDSGECYAQKSQVIHRPSGRKLTYASLASQAANIPAPENPKLKSPEQYTLIGQRIKDVDTAGIVRGAPLYGIDVQVPNLLYASILKPPRFGAKVLRYEDTEALKVPGVKHVIKIEADNRPHFQEGGIAVVANSTWTAMKAKALLKVEWDAGIAPDLSDAQVRAQLQANIQDEQLPVIRADGKLAEAFAQADGHFEASYQLPFLAHATMEPMNYTAFVQKDKCELWGPSQVADGILDEAMMLTNLSAEEITVHLTRLGGGFGRRLDLDYAIDAILISQKINQPVQVVWTREDDFGHDYAKPMASCRLKAAWKDQKLLAWHMLASTTSRYAHRRAQRPLHTTEVFPDEFPAGLIPNFTLSYKHSTYDVPVGPLRAPGHNNTAFFIESFLDELAQQMKVDALQLRLDLIGTPRVMPYRDHGGDYDTGELKQVLEMVAQKAGWGKKLPAWHFQGLAAHVTFGVPVAMVIELSVVEKKIQVHKVFAAVACGLVIELNGAEKQISGGIIDGLGAALYGEMPVKNGAFAARNFDSYQMIRMPDVDFELDIQFVKSTKAPKGLGEMSYPVVAPALCNAIFAATGKRIRDLPVVRHL